jgi:hypothetical protein
MAESWLDEYRDEIIDLRITQRFTPPQISDFLERKTGKRVPKSTLYAYLQRVTESTPPVPAGEPRVSPEEEQYFAQREVYEQITRMAQDMVAGLSDVKARLGVLEDASAERHGAMAVELRALDNRPAAAEADQPALARLENSIQALENRVAGLSIQVIDPALKVRIWKRAALITGLLWAIVAVLAFVYLGPVLWSGSLRAAAPSPTAPVRR